MLVNKKISRDENIFGPHNFVEKILVDLRPYISKFFIKFFKMHKDIPYSISLFSSPWIDRINKSDADLVHLHWVQHEMLSIADIAKIRNRLYGHCMICGHFVEQSISLRMIDGV